MYMTYLIVGLGNPGDKYTYTRHNAGRWLVERLLQTDLNAGPGEKFSKRSDLNAQVTKIKFADHDLVLLLPDTFMNLSGNSVAKAVKKEKVDQVVVVHDELDLPLGQIKVSFGKGSGGHNGVQSIIEALGTKNFVRIRVGIGRTKPEGLIEKLFTGSRKGADYVLGKFSQDELTQLRKMEGEVAEILLTLISEGREKVMNRVNAT